jgi:light-regulated signal transduction histidine kinase (bacteriophytochrome)
MSAAPAGRVPTSARNRAGPLLSSSSAVRSRMRCSSRLLNRTISFFARRRTVDRHHECIAFAVTDDRAVALDTANLVANELKVHGLSAAARIEVRSLTGADGQPVFRARNNAAGFNMVYASRIFEASRQCLHRPTSRAQASAWTSCKVVTRHGRRITCYRGPAMRHEACNA